MAEFPGTFRQPDLPPSTRNETVRSPPDRPVVTDVSTVDSTPLDLDDDHFEVQNELLPVVTKWKSIGFALHLKPKILDGIETQYNGDPPACLAAMVTEWLDRNYNVKRFGEPAWQRLVEAVGHPAGGANVALGSEIARNHMTEGQPTLTVIQQRPPSSQEEVMIQQTPPSSQEEVVIQQTPPSSQEEVVIQQTPPSSQEEVVIQQTPPSSQEEIVIQQTPPSSQEEVKTQNLKTPKCSPNIMDVSEVDSTPLAAKNSPDIVDVSKVDFTSLGPPMLTVTQQTPTSPQGEEEIQMNVLPTLCDPLPPQDVASTLRDPLPPQDVASTLRDPLPPQDVASTLRDPLPPQDVASTLHDPLPHEVVPTLRDLCLLPVPKWYVLGLQLGVSADELDVIERNYPRDNHMCKVKMFGAWLRMDTSATYEKFARALVTVGKRNIAKSMCAARGIPLTVLDNVPVVTVDPLPIPPTLPPEPHECVARYGQYLKDKYKRMSTLPDGDWPPSLGRQCTQLAMIEQKRELPGAELVATMEKDYIHGNIDNIVKRKKAIQLPEIFLPSEDGEQQLKILMDGAPGVGKSTLSRKICKDWSSGELLQQYHLVILLPLRQPRIREATSIEDLIEADDPDLKQQIVRHIQETSGEHVLLIVDGYDELSYKDRTQDSFFLNVVKGIKFSKCSVLVTSRPYASDYLQRLQSVNRHVEVLGFTEEQIEDCILQNIPEKTKATELVQTLKERQDIASLCYIPLNCAIVLYVYKMEQCTLPHSLTKLYEIFILNSIKRHASIAGNDFITMGIHALAEIPESFEKQFNALCKLAYDGLVADKMVFGVKDIKTAFPNCTDFDISNNLLGLMTAFKEFTSTGEELSYQFLHLTIQEFLAARWAASQLSDGELLKFFQDHLQEERYRMMLLFLAGISNLKFSTAEHLFKAELDLKHPNSRECSNRKVVDYFLFLVHLIFESQNFSLFHNLAGTIVGAELTVAWYHITPFDCLVLAHFLAWCDRSLKLLNLSGCGLTSQSLDILHRVNSDHCGTTQIEEVNLSKNHPKLMTKFALLPKLPMFEHTRVFTVNCPQYPKGVSCDQVELHCLLNLRHLTTLEVSVKGIPDSCKKEYSLSLDKFVKVFENKISELQVLRYWKGNIDSQNAVDIFRSLEHNTSLEELDLSENSQLAEGDSEAVGCAIERMLKVNRTLKVLNLSNCVLDTAVVTHTAAGLVHNAALVELNIAWNILSVTSEGWVHLFKALSNTSLKKLHISYNNLGMEGSVALAKILSCNKSLTELNLRSCDIPATGLREIARALLQNTSLKKLDISRNNLGMEASVALAGMLSCNKSLTELNLGLCDIPEAGLREIAGGLLQNTSLKKLDISCNKPGMEGSVALAGMLSCNKSLTELNLRSCDIPKAGLREIARGLLQNTSLRTLRLWSTERKAFLEAEIERLKKSGNFTPQSSSRLEIKTEW